MPFSKYIMLIDRMDGLIRRKSTGSPREFADKLNVSRSMLMYYISEMKDLGAPIKYSKYLGTYYYHIDVHFDPFFRTNDDDDDDE